MISIQSHDKDHFSHEKPLVQCRIVLIDIKDLFGHEQVVQPQVDFLKENLNRLGYFFRPILVVKKHNVILDGHHRVEALKELGGVRIPCIEIDYLDNSDINLSTWYPIYTGSVSDIPEVLNKLDINWTIIEQTDAEKFTDESESFILYSNSGAWSLEGSQQELYGKFIHFFDARKFEYVKTISYAIDSVKSQNASFALLRKTLSKKDVISSAISGQEYAPKTTRHILTFRYQDIRVPLETLID
ncbi:MAG: hypothetical protein FK730_16195 [Asgard group archaeon]|nr:hypothetical protein [Asgard group archaeon]